MIPTFAEFLREMDTPPGTDGPVKQVRQVHTDYVTPKPKQVKNLAPTRHPSRIKPHHKNTHSTRVTLHLKGEPVLSMGESEIDHRDAFKSKSRLATLAKHHANRISQIDKEIKNSLVIDSKTGRTRSNGPYLQNYLYRKKLNEVRVLHARAEHSCRVASSVSNPHTNLSEHARAFEHSSDAKNADRELSVMPKEPNITHTVNAVHVRTQTPSRIQVSIEPGTKTNEFGHHVLGIKGAFTPNAERNGEFVLPYTPPKPA